MKKKIGNLALVPTKFYYHSSYYCKDINGSCNSSHKTTKQHLSLVQILLALQTSALQLLLPHRHKHYYYCATLQLQCENNQLTDCVPADFLRNRQGHIQLTSHSLKSPVIHCQTWSIPMGKYALDTSSTLLTLTQHSLTSR